MVTLPELKARLDTLSPTGIRFVARMVDSLSAPPLAKVNSPASWLPGEWIEYFGLALSVHHGTTTEPLVQKGFETVFRNACESVSWEVGEHGSETRRFLDLEVSPERGQKLKLSLKSTAAQRLSRTSVHISKLTEAAWIQDMRTARERQSRTLALFQEYMQAVDSIMMLRAFRSEQGIPSSYQLVEIPSAIFRSLQEAPLSSFNADGPTIDCPYRGIDIAARVSLDRSDAKITVKQISLEACTVHVEWEMRTT
ncbi:MAG: hypothetical protein F4X09_10975 [Gammaproteobacteria bacterium]|nr:hypothetical protein [Gammaproteobacteria bacterium]MYC60695.1 hypothetical protein [Gammaproteobacteria bacterium]MYH47552.1 hypothetical protein [Gammaproteobacteria bacterium]MYL12265.1 hypothetical protein [Gammaproteobacteria bacterium]